MAPAMHCIGSVPSRSVGLLIGKGGKNIKQLERLSDCRLRTVASKENGDLTELQVISFSCRSCEQEKVAVALLRTARLVCEEGKTIEQGWQIAREERQRAEKLREACRLQLCARKLCVICPEMTLAEASAALQQSNMDEDQALDLFYQGAIVLQKDDAEPRSTEAQKSEEKTEFPTLSQQSDGSSSDVLVCAQEAKAWCPKQVRSTRILHGFAKNAPNTEDNEDFPSLPISKSGNSKASIAASRKCSAKVPANRQCPSFQTSLCATTGQVPRTRNMSGVDLLSIATRRPRC